MGWFSDFVSAPAATLSGTYDGVVRSPLGLINPMTLGANLTDRFTGITPSTQLAIGAVGGTLAAAPVIGVPLQNIVGTGLAEVGAAGAGLFASGGSGAAAGAAAPSLTVGGATLGALHEGAKLLPSAPAPSSPVTVAPAPAADGLAKFTPWLLGAAVVAKVFLL